MQYLQNTIKDVVDGLKKHELWMVLAWSEIVQRYRRSSLGPFWLTISMAISIGVMGPLYARLFGQQITNYVAYLAVGMVIWSLISSTITETSNGFIVAEGFIKEFDLPLSVHIYRVVWRNLIVMAHNMIVVVIVLFFFPPPFSGALLWVPIGLLAITFNSIWLGLMLGLLCARFRDVQQVIASLLMLLFFITPIMWMPKMLEGKAWLLSFNPIYCFIALVRAPLLGETIERGVFINIGLTSMVVMLFSMFLFGKYRQRIAYWV